MSSKKDIDLSIVIVSFNTKALLFGCLQSILETKNDLKIEIIVIDNHSRDGSPEMIKDKFPQVKLILNQINQGFSKANNQGIKIAKGKYILLLNSDTEVKSGAFAELVKFAKSHPGGGIIGAKLLNPDGPVQPSVYHFPTLWRAIREYWLEEKGAYEKYAVTASDAVQVEAVVGAAMLIPRKTIEKIGLLDERYFLYFEDLDYCRRVKKAGLETDYLPTAEVIHHHGASGIGSPKTYGYLIESSKIYHGICKYWILTAIIWSGQKLHRVLG